MNVQSATVDEVKEQIYALVEQLPPAQIFALHHALQTWVMPPSEHGANGAPPHSVALANETLYQEQPWRRYTTRLKESPNWAEFLEALAAARQETHPTENQA